ncbi:MAG: hypothetical protein H8M99_01340 [Gloeobacteraceae cyanobacterium ES-bin-144]|nr:hypothetical protein [Verrucomicrobiales bacterium]
MKPLPAQNTTGEKTPGEGMPILSTVIVTGSGDFSKANRRIQTCSVQRVYPWLLFTSTMIAALFCLMYITKPVIVAASMESPFLERSNKPQVTIASSTPEKASMIPSRERLPGEANPKASSQQTNNPQATHFLPKAPASGAFEETNLRIQHVLNAETPGGHSSRIDIDVPVLYQSRSLRWTPDEIAKARELLSRLMDYQEKSRNLRTEGIELMDAWNNLIGNSIPASDLRADSPSLPANQQHAADAPHREGLITNESIQIQPTGK